METKGVAVNLPASERTGKRRGALIHCAMQNPSFRKLGVFGLLNDAI